MKIISVNRFAPIIIPMSQVIYNVVRIVSTFLSKMENIRSVWLVVQTVGMFLVCNVSIHLVMISILVINTM